MLDLDSLSLFGLVFTQDFLHRICAEGEKWVLLG
jgi:hypothetical protein